MQEGSFTFAGVTFGEGTRLVVENMTTDMGEVRNEDAENPYGDGALPGRDRLGVGSWEWEIATDADDFEHGPGSPRGPSGLSGAQGIVNALDLWESLHAAWRLPVREQEPEKLYPLTYVALGRKRRVYGRPRRADIPNGPSVLAQQGQARGALQFTLHDPYTYGDDPRQHQLSRIAPAPGVGTRLPVRTPFQLGTMGGVRPGVLNVGGTAPTPFIATFHGPVINPFLIGPDWEIHLEGRILAGQSVSVDTRERRVFRGMTNVRGALRRGSTLDGRLQPGLTEVTYGGTDETNTSKVILTWHPAYYSI